MFLSSTTFQALDNKFGNVFAHAKRINKEIEQMKPMKDGDYAGIIQFVETLKLLFRQTEKAGAGQLVQTEQVFNNLIDKLSETMFKSYLNDYPMDPTQLATEKLSSLEDFLERECSQAFQAKA